MAVLNEEQLMLQDMATGWVRDRVPVTAYRTLFEGEFPAGHDPAHYREMAEMGRVKAPAEKCDASHVFMLLRHLRF